LNDLELEIRTRAICCTHNFCCFYWFKHATRKLLHLFILILTIVIFILLVLACSEFLLLNDSSMLLEKKMATPFDLNLNYSYFLCKFCMLHRTLLFPCLRSRFSNLFFCLNKTKLSHHLSVLFSVLLWQTKYLQQCWPCS